MLISVAIMLIWQNLTVWIMHSVLEMQGQETRVARRRRMQRVVVFLKSQKKFPPQRNLIGFSLHWFFVGSPLASLRLSIVGPGPKCDSQNPQCWDQVPTWLHTTLKSLRSLFQLGISMGIFVLRKLNETSFCLLNFVVCERWKRTDDL